MIMATKGGDANGMSEGRFRTMRHIETVRNYLNAVIAEFMSRAEKHDQSKLCPPEVEIIEKFTPKLRDSTYGSPEYLEFLIEMKPAIQHHYAMNRHHPEHFPNGIHGMNLLDLLEMLCDWKASAMRHRDGDLRASLDLNQSRFGFSDELKGLLLNTVEMIEALDVDHHADQS